jgi:hypothetical protein
MELQKHKEESLRKSLHDIRSHLSVILSASELAMLDEATISREEALAVIKSTMAEVEEIIKILGEIEKKSF